MKSSQQMVKWVTLLLLISLLIPAGLATGQTPDGRRPIDMMIAIDNSCSMFPANKILPSCDAFGNDPEYLRIMGANLFLARLGFADANEAEYQAGILSFGNEPATLVAPLQPLAGVRNELAAKIANPEPQEATQMLPALRMAYEELKNSPNRRQNNLPAVVMITDGVPYPKEGQTSKDIEELINQYPSTALFMIILQSGTPSEDFKSYIEFWKGLASRNPRIFVFPITDPNQIEETYNAIVAQLQNTIPAKGLQIKADQTISFYVSEYLQKIIITVIHRNLRDTAPVVITDPTGTEVTMLDSGVSYFKGEQNPIEVISIAAPRLGAELKKASWKITSSSDVTVLVDREGSYRFNFLEPVAGPSDVTNVFISSEPINPNREIAIRFNLLDASGAPVAEPQQIQVEVTLPDGRVKPLGGLNVVVNSEGEYEMRFSPASVYSEVLNKPGRFIFLFKAGQADENSSEAIPITTSRLILDMGRAPTIRSVNPQPLVCAPGWDAELRVTLEDTDVAQTDSLLVKAILGGQEQVLTSKDFLFYKGNLNNMCQAALAQAGCSADRNLSLTVQLTGLLADGSTLPVLERDVQVNVNTPACTPTPLPTATATPAPTATPLPDRDGDGVTDALDECQAIYGTTEEKGCPPMTYPMATLGGGLALLAFVAIVFPWFKVHTFGKPPEGFVQVVRAGKPAQPVSLHTLGMKKRVSHISIGGTRKSSLVVEGLQPVEFFAEWQGSNIALRQADEKEPFALFDRVPRAIHTSDPKVVLRIALDRDSLLE